MSHVCLFVSAFSIGFRKLVPAGLVMDVHVWSWSLQVPLYVYERPPNVNINISAGIFWPIGVLADIFVSNLHLIRTRTGS